MHITFIVIFAIIFLVTLLCIFIFRKYKGNLLEQFDDKRLSLRFMWGFSAICVDSLYKLPLFRNSQGLAKKKQLLSTLDTNISPEKNIYLHYMRLVSYTIVVVLICSFLGLAYTITISDTNRNNVIDLTRPAVGDGNQNISLITDSEMYSGTIEISVEEKEYSFDEIMDIFSSHRVDFDNFVLGENTSFLYVTSSLNFPSTWGDEGISVSWHISNPDIIDYSGSIKNENLSEDGLALEIVATLTLANISADICYQIKVFPADVTPKDSLVSYINDYINSDANSTKGIVTLPDEINGHKLSFFKEDTVYPSLDFSYSCTASYDSYNLV